MPIKPVLLSSVALVGVGAVVAAGPAVLPATQTTVAVAAPMRTLGTDQVRLLALSDVTLQSIIETYTDGYGGGVQPGNPYYELDEEDYPIYLTGIPAVGYYLIDETLLTIVDTNLPLLAPAAQFGYDWVTSYYYEIGASAAFHVALSEATGGRYTPFGELLQSIFNPGYNPPPADSADTLRATVQTAVGTLTGKAGSGPEVLPKKRAAVVDISATSSTLSDDPGAASVVTTSGPTDEPKPVKVAKEPKFNAHRVNPLSGKVGQFAKDAKKEIRKGLGSVAHGTKALSGTKADTEKDSSSGPGESSGDAD